MYVINTFSEELEIKSHKDIRYLSTPTATYTFTVLIPGKFESAFLWALIRGSP
jgi:hypothetical protein